MDDERQRWLSDWVVLPGYDAWVCSLIEQFRLNGSTGVEAVRYVRFLLERVGDPAGEQALCFRASIARFAVGGGE
jgi:hypothetical protein